MQCEAHLSICSAAITTLLGAGSDPKLLEQKPCELGCKHNIFPLKVYFSFFICRTLVLEMESAEASGAHVQTEYICSIMQEPALLRSCAGVCRNPCTALDVSSLCPSLTVMLNFCHLCLSFELPHRAELRPVWIPCMCCR